MNESLKISVLIPVYNVEPYLVQCLESICSQTLREIEVICVDDASTDGSLAILRDFAKRDPRVKVVQVASNQGQSHARNLAMRLASGEYLMLVDADDWLESDILREMWNLCERLKLDRVSCGFRYYYEDAPNKKDCFIPDNVADPQTGWIACNPETIGKVHYGAGGLMIRRALVEQYGFFFPEGFICEDLYFHCVSFPRCRRACVIRKPSYVYRKHPGSSTSLLTSGNSRVALNYLAIIRLIFEDWKRTGILEEYRTAFLKMLVMCVRNIRKYAPHAVQKNVTQEVAELLQQENLFSPGVDEAGLSHREVKLLKTWLNGKSGLDFSYYWKRMRKVLPSLWHRS